MTITYQLESWKDYHKDCQELWVEHYDEIAVQKDKIKMNPNVEHYKQMEEVGGLHIITVREDGKMIGYHVSFVRAHPHYADMLCGFVDAYFLTASKRKGMTGVKMIKEAENSLKKRGVKKLFSGTKNSKDMSKVFEYLGWHLTEQLFTKYIGE